MTFTNDNQVLLIAAKNFGDILRLVLKNALQPVCYVLKGFSVRQVENNYHSVSIFVKLVGHSFEAFLSSCVPKFDFQRTLAILSVVQVLDAIEAHCADMVFIEFARVEELQETGFADSAVANNHDV